MASPNRLATCARGLTHHANSKRTRAIQSGQTGASSSRALIRRRYRSSTPVSDVLKATASAEVDQEAGADAEALDDDYDARLRVHRQIVSRRGQAGFRAALLEAYRGRCPITGCEVAAALEGAHLRPYRGSNLTQSISNGLLLRADIHTLFDLGLLAPDPVTRTIVVSKLRAGTQYQALSTFQLADPAGTWQRPNQESLEIIWHRFCEAEDNR